MNYLLYFCLFFTCTGLLPFSALSSVLFPIQYLRLFFLKRIKSYVFWMFLFFFISFLNISIYHYSSFLDFSFYRRDGNFIVSFAPLFVFSFFCLKFDISKVFRFLLYSFTAVNIFIVVGNFIIYKNYSWLFNRGENININFLFDANNAAGGWMSLVICLAFAFWVKYRRLSYFFILLFNSLVFIAINSRGSILGVFAAIFIFTLSRNKTKLFTRYFILCLLCASVATCISLFWGYPIYLETVNHLSTVQSDISSGKEANIYIRLLDNWPRGFHAFLQSPFFGTGFGSLNDLPFNFVGVDGLLSINSPNEYVFNSNHAHHSYLHILGEQGVFGLSIFMMFWKSLYQSITKSLVPGEVKVYLMTSLVSIMVAGFTEHRMTTPSTILPFILSVCVWHVYNNYSKVEYDKR